MRFTKAEITAFKSKGKKYLTFNNQLDPFRLNAFFYSVNKLKERFPFDEFCEISIPIYDGKSDTVEIGLKYVSDKKITYYLFSYKRGKDEIPKQTFAIGKLVGDTIYLIRESLARENKNNILETLRIDKKTKRMIYYNKLCFTPGKETRVNSYDADCIRNAYEAIRAYNKLGKYANI